MGSWGVSFFESDAALDFVCHWEKYIVPCLENNIWDAKKVWDFYRVIYFKDRFDISSSIQNNEVLALAFLYVEYNLKHPGEFKDIIQNVLNAELKKSTLNEWNEPSVRKKELIKSLNLFGLKKKKLSSEDIGNSGLDVYINEVLPFVKNIKKMVAAICPPSAYDEFEKYYPSFFNDIDNLITSGMPSPIEYTDQEMKLIKFRLQLLAFYLGWKTRLSADDIHKLINSAKQTEGYIIFNSDILD